MALEAEREGKSLFTHSRRTASPPLNSSVSAHVNTPYMQLDRSGLRHRIIQRPVFLPSSLTGKRYGWQSYERRVFQLWSLSLRAKVLAAFDATGKITVVQHFYQALLLTHDSSCFGLHGFAGVVLALGCANQSLEADGSAAAQLQR